MKSSDARNTVSRWGLSGDRRFKLQTLRENTHQVDDSAHVAGLQKDGKHFCKSEVKKKKLKKKGKERGKKKRHATRRS